MRTQLIDEPGTSVSYLEQIAADGMTPNRTPIESFPFLIGRDETADYQIDSGRVSREHAQIRQEGRTLRIEDLGSTNGTFVNGKRVESSLLHNGDIVTIADIEFTFGSAGEGIHRETVTQIIADDEQSADPHQLIREVRRLQEILAQDAITPRYRPIVEFGNNQTFGFEATIESVAVPGGPTVPDPVIANVECMLLERLYQAIRYASVRDSSELPASAHLLLSIHASEVGGESLIDSIATLRSFLTGSRRLIVAVPEEVYSNVDYFDALHDQIRSLGVVVCCDGVRAEHAGLLRGWKVHPTLLRLADSASLSLHQNGVQRSQLHKLAETALQCGIEMVGPALMNEQDRNAFRQLGCRYGQGADV